MIKVIARALVAILATFLTPMAPPAHATGDTSGPVAVSFNLSTSSVEVGASAGSFTISGQVTDASGIGVLSFSCVGASGSIWQANVPNFTNYNQAFFKAAYDGLTLVNTTNGNRNDFTFSFTGTIPVGFPTGSCTPTLGMTDSLGNSSSTTTAAFSVTRTSGTWTDSPPQFSALTVTPNSVDVSAAVANISISGSMTSATGAKYISFSCRQANGQLVWDGLAWNNGNFSSASFAVGSISRPASISVTGNLNSLTFTVNTSIPTGVNGGSCTPTLRSEDLYRRLNTFSSTQSFTIQQAAPADIQAPQVRSLTISPMSIDVGAEAASVNFAARVTDATGIHMMKLACNGGGAVGWETWLYANTNFSSGWFGLSYAVRGGSISFTTSGDKKDLTFSGVGLVTKGAVAGTCTPTLTTYDELNNQTTFSLGSTFTISNAGDLISAPTPTIQGTPALGQTLTVATGAWTPSDVGLVYQWLRNGVAIGGATATSYKLQASDVAAQISVQVTGSKAGFVTSSKTSASTPLVAPGAIVPGSVSISGIAKPGSVLVANRGAWSPSDLSFAYQWFRNDTPIQGANSVNYSVSSEDVGADLTVTVTGSAQSFEGKTAESGKARVVSEATTPSVINIDITVGAAGTKVTITGTNLNTVVSITFNGVPAPVISPASATKLVTQVPTGAKSGQVALVTPSGSIILSKTFTVIGPKPVISSFTPASSKFGSAVVIVGKNFLGAKSVSIGTTKVSFKVLSEGVITISAPKKSLTGKISITTPSGTVKSAKLLRVSKR